MKSTDTHACSRCGLEIPPGEIAAKTGDHWLCSVCWKTWSVTRARLVQAALAEFVATGGSLIGSALDRIEAELDSTSPCESSRETRRWTFRNLPCVKEWRKQIEEASGGSSSLQG